jgi:hypothetical protein
VPVRWVKIRQYAGPFEVEEEWRWGGTHYQRTALDWLANFAAHAEVDRSRAAHGLWQRHAPAEAALAAGSSSLPRACSATPARTNGRQPLPDESSRDSGSIRSQATELDVTIR